LKFKFQPKTVITLSLGVAQMVLVQHKDFTIKVVQVC